MANKLSATPRVPAAGTMTLLDHLRELRNRLIKCSAAILAGLLGGLWIVNSTNFIAYLIRNFVGEQGVQTTEVTESFTSFIGVGLTIGIICAMPVIIYQLLAFLTPGLTRKEKRWIFIGLPLVIVFFVGGLAFGWFITAPAAIKFLVGFGVSNSANLIENKPTLQDFLAILTRLLLINGIIFEMPMVMFTLAKLNILNPRKVAKYRRYIVLGVVVAAAILTPTGDPANLALIAVPMYLLFEFGLLLGRMARPIKR
jgi:sec-independent protein translocase protein TatC